MEKKFYNSKKFIAFAFSMLVLASIAILALCTQEFNWAMSAFMCILCSGMASLSIGYVVSQKSLDRFLASVSVMNSQGEEDL